MLVTTGSQQGLDLVARVLFDPGDVVLVELPTYTGAITAFRNVQAQMVGVPQEADGIDLDALDATYQRLRRDGRRVKALVRRAQLPESDGPADRPRQAPAAARRGPRGRDVLIIEDDPYHELYFEDSATEAEVRPIKADDRDGRVVYLSSFSKTLAPGYRVAWIAAPAAVAREARDGQAVGGPADRIARPAVVHEACRSGLLARQLPKLRAALSAEARRDGRRAPARAERHGHLAGSQGRILPLADAAAISSTPT